jgi:hypothetical protein
VNAAMRYVISSGQGTIAAAYIGTEEGWNNLAMVQEYGRREYKEEKRCSNMGHQPLLAGFTQISLSCAIALCVSIGA